MDSFWQKSFYDKQTGEIYLVLVCSHEIFADIYEGLHEVDVLFS